MSEEKIQRLVDEADALRASGEYLPSVGKYLGALELSRKIKGDDVGSDEWHCKVWYMACTGMGIAYAKYGNLLDAVENFKDAIAFAPNDDALKVAQENYNKYAQALAEKHDITIHDL